MAKKKKKKKPAKRVPNDLQAAAESRSELAAKVAWSLTLLSTLAAEAMGFVCQLYVRFAEPVTLLQVLGGVMLFVALVAGVVTLLLTPLVLKLAKTRPPSSIVLTAIVAGVLPLVVVVFQYLGSAM